MRPPRASFLDLIYKTAEPHRGAHRNENPDVAVKASDQEAAQEKGVGTVFLPGFFTSSGEEPASREGAGRWAPIILTISLGFALAAGGGTGWCRGPAAGGWCPLCLSCPQTMRQHGRLSSLCASTEHSVCRQRSGSKWGGVPALKGGRRRRTWALSCQRLSLREHSTHLMPRVTTQKGVFGSGRVMFEVDLTDFLRGVALPAEGSV